MKLSQQELKELMHVYDTWWHSYLNGDVETYDSYLADDYRFVGSTDGEDYLSREETTKFFELTADQLAGVTKLENLKRDIKELDGGLIIITDLADAFVLYNSEWVYYSGFRFTSLMRKGEGGWRFIYQHFSAPDSKAQEGETLGTEQITKENQELKDAIKRRTKELEYKTRELEIESALEKVRARTMAMQNSEELNEVLSVVFKQFDNLGIEARVAHLILFDEINNTFSFRMTGLSGQRTMVEQIIDIDKFEAWRNAYRVWKEKKTNTVICIEYTPEDLPAVREAFAEIFDALPEESKMRIEDYPEGLFTTRGHCKFGYLGFNHTRKATEEEKNIVSRLANEFGSVYQRFLDLKKAEEQAREARIEASLERVRSRAMAIRKSEELYEVIQIIFQELEKLGFDLLECSIVTYDKNPLDLIYWSTGTYGSALPTSVKLQYFDHPVLVNMFNDFKKGIKYRSGEYSGELLKTWWERVFVETDFKQAPQDFIESWKKIKHIFYSQAAMNHGFLEFVGQSPLPEEKVQILKRFTNVVDLTYTRYDDVMKAEAQAKEVTIEIALEKVRNRSLSMQTSEELKEVIQVIHDQLINLNFEIDSAGFTLDYYQNNDWNVWIANKNQSLPTLMYIPYIDHPQFNYYKSAKEKGLDFFANTLSHEDKNSIFSYMFEFMGDFPQEEKDEILNAPGLAISQAFFKNITLWIYNLDGIPYSEEDNAILMRFARVFEQTYVRFNDLKQAEKLARQAQIDLENLIVAKKKTEDALTELKVTQSQLIHAEKMASLGELTAGIAHEIQNPLNFVNNFSEISGEMIDEVNEEIETGDVDEAKEILHDLKGNLEKINHHGQRASGIVKSMLDHSRTTSGEKVETDINALCDEYLRLAYHGMRAKDRSFNSNFEMDLDDSIPKIKVIPQDIGRVLLNLINNAFQAVHEKSLTGLKAPSGMVKVTTKNLGDRIEITVSDNGPGIPDDIKDKIFQPFFTTKPTGQGTGLGLSLSYDIVKAHGGELKVETKESHSTEFKIALPII